MNRLAILVFLVLLAACNTGNPTSSPSPVSKPLGLLKVDISSAGDASVQWTNAVSSQSVSIKPINGTAGINDIQFQKSAVGSYDDLIKGRRYVVTTFNLTNRTNIAFNNFTLYAVHVPGTTRAGTGIVSINDVADNLITNEAVYRSFQPSHGMGPGVGGLQVNPAIADLQFFLPTEAASAQSQAIVQSIIPSGSTVLEYGFVARNLSGGRAVAGRNTPSDCTNNTCKASITLSYSFPIQTPASANPFRFSLYFVAADESNSYISQSLEERFSNKTAGLLDTSSFTETRVLAATSFGLGLESLNNVCQVKTAVATAANPSNVLLPNALPNPTAGSLDSCFRTGGKRTLDFDPGYGIAVLPDGKMIVAGSRFSLARINPNGSLDTTFGIGGKTTLAFPLFFAQSTSLALQPDGKIVLGGFIGNPYPSNDDFALVRYNPDGSFDMTFGTGGKVVTAVGPNRDDAFFIAIQSDGKIVLSGSSYNASGIPDFALARYNPDGSLDTTFDGDGKAITDFDSRIDFAFGLAVQPDGKIVLGGYSFVARGTSKFAVARYNPDGSLDTSFDGDGKVLTDLSPGSGSGRTLALQPDGKILLAGWGLSNPSNGRSDFVLVRYNPNGSLDTGFDGDGMVFTAINGTSSEARAIALQPDGKILVAGEGYNGGFDYAVARYNTNGSLDRTFGFGAGGIVTTSFVEGTDYPSAMAVQPDGKFVVVGQSELGFGGFSIARYYY